MAHPSYFIHPTAQIGCRFRPLQGFVPCEWDFPRTALPSPTRLHVGAFAVIGEHVVIGERVVIDDFCKIGSGVVLDEEVLVIYRANIGGFARIGARSIIGGTVSENCHVGEDCRVFGRVIHRQADSTASWDHADPEPSVTIRDWSFIGFDAVVLGGITIGPRAYVCANATVTRDVPPLHIAYGINHMCHYSEWKGTLRDNPLFREG